MPLDSVCALALPCREAIPGLPGSPAPPSRTAFSSKSQALPQLVKQPKESSFAADVSSPGPRPQRKQESENNGLVVDSGALGGIPGVPLSIVSGHLWSATPAGVGLQFLLTNGDFAK